MAYLTSKSSRIDGHSIRALTDIPGILTEHNIKIPKGVQEATDRHEQIVASIKDMAAGVDANTAHETAARSLADGTATPEQITVAAASRMIAQRDPGSPYQQILNRGRDLAAQDLKTAYAQHGNDWITKILKPALEKATAVLINETQHSPAYDAFRDPRAAEHWLRNPRVEQAWDTITAIYDVARKLRRYGAIPATDRRDDWFEWSGEGEYTTRRGGDHLVASVRDTMQPNNITWWLMAVQYGMTPTLLTDEEAAAKSK